MQQRARLTPLILRHIADEIEHGRALWGLLKANEYMRKECPLRKVLAMKANPILRQLSNNPDLAKHITDIMDGKRLDEIPCKVAIALRKAARNLAISSTARNLASNTPLSGRRFILRSYGIQRRVLRESRSKLHINPASPSLSLTQVPAHTP